MKQIKKDLIITIILLSVIIVSYPLLIGGAYSLADQDDRVIPTIKGIKPVIDGLYVLAFVLGCLTISCNLWYHQQLNEIDNICAHAKSKSLKKSKRY